MVETLAPRAGQTTLLATLYVRDALCGLDAADVQEVIRLGPLTAVRNAPPAVAGIVNLRGRIVTLLDLSLQLGLGKTTPGAESRIFIVEDRGEFVGLLVDKAGEVVETERGEWQPLPANVLRNQAQFFRGVCRVDGHAIAILDVARVLSGRAE